MDIEKHDFFTLNLPRGGQINLHMNIQHRLVKYKKKGTEEEKKKGTEEEVGWQSRRRRGSAGGQGQRRRRRRGSAGEVDRRRRWSSASGQIQKDLRLWWWRGWSCDGGDGTAVAAGMELQRRGWSCGDGGAGGEGLARGAHLRAAVEVA